MRAMPNEEIPSTYAEKKNKIVEGTPRRLYISHFPFNEADLCRDGKGHFRS